MKSGPVVVLVKYLLIAFFALTSMHVTAQEQVFRAGAYKSNITPELGGEIVGNYVTPPATYVHDELHARAIAMDDGNTRLAIVLVDNVSIKREVFDQARMYVREETGLPGANLLMAATHTHSATSASGVGDKRKGWNTGNDLDPYQMFVARRIADAVRIAMENLEPARIAWSSCDAPEHVFNRRWMMREPVLNPLGTYDLAKMNPGVGNPDLVEPAGPIDPEVSFISLQSIDGRPIALLANYSLHYVGGVPKGHISADYFAIFADRVQELIGADRLGPPFVGIMSNGTSGDINNINFRGPVEKNLPYAKMTLVANDVAQKVFREYQNLEYRNWVPLGAAMTEMSLDVRRATPEVLSNLKKIEARPDGDDPLFHSLEKIYADRIAQMEAEWPDQVEIILQTLRIGELGIAALPFETFAETGLEIKAKSSLGKTFTIELANGSYGYLPTPEQHKKGGYETWISTNKVEVDATNKIVDELMTLFEEARN